jgi:hypothetical protein
MKTPLFSTALRQGLLLLLLACVLAAMPGRAQTPQFMTYQGYLTDQNGVALATNGPQNFDVVFRIWNQPTAGNELYGELQTVTVQNGYFSVLLGQGSTYLNAGIPEPRPPLSSVFTTNNIISTNRFVELTVQGIGNGGANVTILPRLQLVTTPYAFLAANANALVSPTTGNTLISSTGSNVTVNSSSLAFSGNLTNSGGSIYMDNAQSLFGKNTGGAYELCLSPRWSDNVTYLNYGSGGFNIRNDSSNSTMWMGNNGNIGIGTTSPSFPLSFASVLGDKIGLWGGPGANYGFGIQSGLLQIHTDVYGSDIAFGYGQSAAFAENMRIKGNGLVGIGTSSPGYTLDINGTEHVGSYMSIGTSAYSSIGLEVRGGAIAGIEVANSGEYYGLFVDYGSLYYGAYIYGNVEVTGTLSKGSGTFKIDHPLDPENKWLYHSFVESPDMMNVYNGNIVTDGNGDATVLLPSYFQALNKDFRYQLTVMGQFAQAMVSSEISSNSLGINFGIKTDKPSVKVSWQVTGVRQDAFANAHRVIPEVAKTGGEVGTYIHPIEHGQPEAKRFQPLQHKTNDQ